MKADDDRFYAVHTPYKYYMDINDKTVLKQCFLDKLISLIPKKDYFLRNGKKSR